MTDDERRVEGFIVVADKKRAALRAAAHGSAGQSGMMGARIPRDVMAIRRKRLAAVQAAVEKKKGKK